MADQQSFDAFYTASVQRVTGQIFLVIGDREEARDCVQEAFERAWLRWDSVGAMGAPEAWVRTVARRLAVSRWRKARNAVTAWHRERAGHQLSIDPGHGSSQRISLVAALQQLPEAQRTAIVLHHLCDLDVATVAAETGATASAVKSQLSRGRQALAALLHDPSIDDPAASRWEPATPPPPAALVDTHIQKVTP
jgi:RNA polymerase sigma-70 factor (ECF subfamily)